MIRLFGVNFTEFNKTIVLVLSLLFSFCEERFCSVGELLSETAVTSFALDEVDVVSGGSLAVNRESVFVRRVVAEELPVAC